MSEQTRLFIWNNQNLFSNNYLEHHLPSTKIWQEQKEKAAAVIEEARKTYESIKTLKLGPGEESGLEDKFIRPILNMLGFERDVQPPTPRGKKLDYVLFKDRASLNDARREKDDLTRYFSHPLTILEAKYWGRRLNDVDPRDTLDRRDPTAQTVKYLDDVYHASNGRIQWAILTNGKQWRLFYYKAASRSGNFFEIDLEEIINKGSLDGFLYFYLFFSKDAFIPDTATGKTWLDQHLEGSESYASAVSERLKGLIFDNVFEMLAEGFIHYRRSKLSILEESPESKKEIFKGCLTLLYRLLFLLYAESRNLLPVEENGYYRVSLKKLKEDIYKDLSSGGLERMSKKSYIYWARLESLFNIIANGDANLNVPVYNGGLFENNLNSRGEVASPLQYGATTPLQNKIADPFLAEAIELLTVDQEGEESPGTPRYIDYSSLNVRHLGDIYEGLLEFHIQIAEEDVVEVKENNKSIWKRLSQIEAGTRAYSRKTKGEVYIENSKHERRISGSYFTPHYIVEYIVKNTVGPVLDERLNKASELLDELESLYEKQRRELKKDKDWRRYEHPGEPKGKHIEEIIRKENEVFETLFDIKALDPAMGSGHFLVHTVDFISDKIIAFLADYPENPIIRKIEILRQEIVAEIKRQGIRIDEGKLTEVNLIKRMVMKRCIYGVDLNEMAVELAKLSLWLDSFTLGAPLSFLDHHLKCGNSLIGILDISAVVHSSSEAYSKMQRALSFMLQVSELTDATISEAKKSYDLFKEAQRTIEPIRRRFNVNTAKHFTDLGSNILSIENLAYSLEFDKETFPENVERCKKALSIASEKTFFHWRLEFPEVFYTEKREKENPGFDCVIGNPPYIQLSMYEAVRSELQSYLLQRYVFSMGRLNTFGFFTKLGLELTKLYGFISMIVPNTFLTMPYYSDFREYILNTAKINSLLIFDSLPFEEAIVENVVYVFEKNNIANILQSNEVKIYDAVKIMNDINVPLRIIPQKYYYTLFERTFNPYLTPQLIKLFDKLNKDTISLENMVEINQAIALKHDRAKYLSALQKGTQYKKVLDGRDIDRYKLEFSGTYLKYEKEAIHSCKREDIFLTKEKIFLRRVGEKIIATLDTEQHYALNTLVVINSKTENANSRFVLSLLNSNLLNWYFLIFLKSTKDVFSEIQARQIEQLPIPRISFTTPEKERRKKVAEFKGMYKEWIKNFGM